MDLDNSKANLCLIHSTKKIKFFCRECKKLYCLLCNQTDNENHKVQKLPKHLISHYEFEKFLGYGSYGLVFKVKDLKKSLPYALKMIPTEEDDDIDLLEHQIHSKIVHSNIIKYFESFWLKKQKLFVILMELAEKSLSEEIKEISQETAFRYFRQIMEALRYLHEDLKTIHRDIKHENILLKEGNIKLCDMGEAKTMEKSWLKLSNKKGFGTKKYQAPEVMNGRKYNEKNDIWAAGIVFHMMLGGGAHPLGNTAKEVSENVKKQKLRLSSSIKNKKHIEILKSMNCIFLSFFNVFKGCLNFKEEERFSARQVLGLMATTDKIVN